MRKKGAEANVFSLLLCFTLVLAAVCPAQAASAPETVRVGFYFLDGYHEMDEDGNRSGYGYDLFQLTQKYANLNYEYLGYDQSWEDIQQMVLDGDIDVSSPAYKTEERMELYDFTLPIGTSSVVLSTRSSETRFTAEDYATYDGMTVGLLAASGANDMMAEFAEKNGFSYTPVYYEAVDALEDALAQGAVDAVATISLRKMGDEKVLSEFDTQAFYAIVKKGNTALLEKLNYAIEQMNSTEGDWKNTFYYNNYGADGSGALSFTADELAFIQRYSTGGEQLVVAVDNDWKPFSWKEGDAFTGILPEYIAACLDLCGMNYVFYDYEGSVFTPSVENLQNVDLYVGYRPPGDGDGDGLLTSATLLENGAAYLQSRDSGEIKTLAIAATTPILNTRAAHDADGVTVVEYPDTAAAKQAVLDGEVDAAFLYGYDAEYTVNQDRTGKLVFTMLPDEPFQFKAVMRSDGDHTLMSILMKCINHLPDTEKSAITSKYVSFSVTELTLEDYVVMHPATAVAVAAAVLLALFVIISILLKNRAEQRYRASLEGKLDEITALNGQLAAQQAEYEKACRQAEAANNAKTTFLFNMSHDIRTPMNAIVGFADLLEKHQDEPERRADYLKKIQDSSAVLLSIINNVLEMARIEKGTLVIEEKAWGAEQFNDSLYDVFQDMMQKKDIKFTRQISVDHRYTYCDPTKLREVFINILSNAYKYTEPGGTVHMALDEIPCQRDGYALYRTTIADTGMGMSADYLPHLFEEFSRENNTTGNKIEGTGLGMPIVKRLVDLMGGTIQVSSQKGVGTTFVVTIPHRIAQAPEQEETDDGHLDTQQFKGKRILLAEDNDLNAEIAIELLEEAGFLVERAEDGRVCVDMLERAEERFYDVILMDVQMPTLNGYEATGIIRNMPDRAKADIPIIAMTANAFEEDKRAAKQAGMNDHLAKPVDVQELYKTLMVILGQERVGHDTGSGT